MAQLTFHVSRRGSKEKIECSASIPSKRDCAKYEGGKIIVRTPQGEFPINVDSGPDLFLMALTIQLQKVRDFVLPKDNEDKPSSNGKRTTYQD